MIRTVSWIGYGTKHESQIDAALSPNISPFSVMWIDWPLREIDIPPILIPNWLAWADLRTTNKS